MTGLSNKRTDVRVDDRTHSSIQHCVCLNVDGLNYVNIHRYACTRFESQENTLNVQRNCIQRYINHAYCINFFAGESARK